MMKNIKNFFTSKVTLAVLACLLLVGVFAGITVLATENTPALELTGVGINHDATPAIKYDVTITGLSGEITDNLDRYEMRFWGYEPADVNDAGYTDVASVANNRAFFGEYADGAQSVSFLSKGFSPKEMTDTLFAAAVYVDEDGNVAAATAVKRYSVFEYICEVNFAGNADQKALVAALKDYISYAQQYLGYTDSAAPSEVGYMKVTNGKFWVVEHTEKDGYVKVNDTAYTSGTFLVGTNFWVEADYEAAVFKRVDGGWYNYPQSSATGLNNVYITTVSAGDATRHYQALPATEVTFSYAEGYELLAMTGNIIDKDYSYNRVNATPVANGAATITSDAIENVRYALVAELYDADGVMFSHWEDADGNVLGTVNPVLDVTGMINNDVYAQTLDLSGITAVYEATEGDRYTSFNSITGGGSVDLPSVGENGELIYDSTSRPTTNPGGQTANITGDTTGDKLANVSQIVWSFDFEVTANNDNADGKWTMTDFFTGTSNACAYQIRPSVALNSHEAALCYYQFYALKDGDNNVTGWYVNLANGSNNNKHMSFTSAQNVMSVEGKHNVTLIVDVETLENGRLVQKGVSVYTDGVYAGTAQRTYNDYASINYQNDVAVYWSTLMRSKLMVTITDMYMKAFI